LLIRFIYKISYIFIRFVNKICLQDLFIRFVNKISL
jgi:hypothetical protein